MQYKLESDFRKHLESQELARVYLLYGAQSYLIAKYLGQLMKKTLGSAYNDFNLHRFEGASFDMQAFYDAVESLPMFASNRCVTLDIDTDKLSADLMKELCGVLADPPTTTTVIITVQNPQPKKDKFGPLLKVCDKAGVAVELGTPAKADLQRTLRNRAQKNGCELSSDTVNYLMERCSDDLQLLITETDKLCAYAGGGVIDRAAVDAVVCAVLQARVFDLSKAIQRGNFTKAMELVDQLMDMREPVPKVLAVLSGAFVDLYRGYAARQMAVPASQAATELGYAKNREFVLKNAMSDSAGYSPKELGKMLDTLAQADLRLKSTGAVDRVILEQTIARLFALTGRA